MVEMHPAYIAMLTMLGTMVIVGLGVLLNNSRLSDLRVLIEGNHATLKSLIDGNHATLKSLIDSNHANLKSLIDSNHTNVRSEMQDLRTGMQDLRSEVRTAIQDLRVTMDARFAEQKAELLRVEQVMDARLRHLEEHL